MAKQNPKTGKAHRREKLRRSRLGDPLNEAAVKADILRYADDSAQETQALFNGLPEATVMFVPAGGLNWTPIRRFSDICNVFIYADWTIDSRECADSLNWVQPGCCALDRSKVEEVFAPAAVVNDLPWLHGAPGAELPAPWAEVAKLKVRTVSGMRTVWLIYLGGNPIEAYRAIFTRRRPQFSPRFIFLSQPENAPQEAWHAFAGLEGALRQAINENPRRPHGIIADI